MSDDRLAQARAEAERRYWADPASGTSLPGYVGPFTAGVEWADANPYSTPAALAAAYEDGQREALLDGEAVERVADILEALDGDDYLTVARAALAAALGEAEGDE